MSMMVVVKIQIKIKFSQTAPNPETGDDLNAPTENYSPEAQDGIETADVKGEDTVEDSKTVSDLEAPDENYGPD